MSTVSGSKIGPFLQFLDLSYSQIRILRGPMDYEWSLHVCLTLQESANIYGSIYGSKTPNKKSKL